MVRVEDLFYGDGSDSVVSISALSPCLTAVELLTPDEPSAICGTLCAVTGVVATVVTVI